MSDITLNGVVYRTSYRATKPVVFIDFKDHKKLYDWWRDNHIDTGLGELVHPVLNKKYPQISAESTAKNIKDATLVAITIGVAKRIRGGNPHIGIKTKGIKIIENED